MDARPTWYRWYVLALLATAYAFSFIDRMILSLIVEPIRTDLQISDTQVSLLMGLAFAIFYTVMGIPLARYADRGSRRRLIAAGMTVWCLMTAVCGLARTFWQLFVARVGVGVGEAALSPAASSLIADYFPQRLLGRAMAVYAMGISIGAGLALLVGGEVVAYVSRAGSIVLPLLGELKAWQAAFLIVGLPGLVVAALIGTIAEPKRTGLVAGKAGVKLPVADGLRFLLGNWRTYAAHFVGVSVTTIMAYGYLAWVPTFFIREHGWPVDRIGQAYGLVLGVFGVIGVLTGGWLADRLYARGQTDAHWWVILLAVAVLLPAYIFVTLVPSPWWSLALLAPGIVGGSMPAAAGPAALMIITPNELRALVAAIYYFVINLIGLTIGPTAVALLTDYYFKDAARLPDSLAIVAALSWAAAVLVLLAGTRHYRRSVEAAQAWLNEEART